MYVSARTLQGSKVNYCRAMGIAVNATYTVPFLNGNIYRSVLNGTNRNLGAFTLVSGMALMASVNGVKVKVRQIQLTRCNDQKVPEGCVIWESW